MIQKPENKINKYKTLAFYDGMLWQFLYISNNKRQFIFVNWNYTPVCFAYKSDLIKKLAIMLNGFSMAFTKFTCMLITQAVPKIILVVPNHQWGQPSSSRASCLAYNLYPFQWYKLTNMTSEYTDWASQNGYDVGTFYYNWVRFQVFGTALAISTCEIVQHEIL